MALRTAARKRAQPVVCSIGTTDPTAGAGLFADARLYARLGVRAVYVAAGITAQNSGGVDAVYSLTPDAIRAQLESIWVQVRPAAVRVGLIPGSQSADAVRRFLARAKPRHVVVDPVLSSTSGSRLADADDVLALTHLARLATLVTPNAHEAAELAGLAVDDVDEAISAAKTLARRFDAAVLVKGGHIDGPDVVDVLVAGDRVMRFRSRRLHRDMRGTGCALASSIAAFLARGDGVESSVRRARAFVARAIAAALPLGKGRPQLV